MTIVESDGVGLADALPRRQVLRGNVVQGIGPADRAGGGIGRLIDCGQRKCAERGGVSRGGREAGGMPVAEIDVAKADGAGSGGGAVLDHGAGLRATGNGDRVVGAGNSDLNGLSDYSAMLVVDRDLELLELALARGQVFHCSGRHRIGPSHLATAAAARRVGVLY